MQGDQKEVYWARVSVYSEVHATMTVFTRKGCSGALTIKYVGTYMHIEVAAKEIDFECLKSGGDRQMTK